ncbi:hypothetical protein [Rhodococcus sovatensis]|uniref:Uncharacterized protein n=1 Tax=Rhodococcus sovatensis TaxID=1805840 RepID=A0ABZ2PNX5_9NOCA
MSSEYAIASDLRELLIEARQTPPWTMDLGHTIFESKASPSKTIVLPGWKSEKFLAAGFDAVEAIAMEYPRAHGDHADPDAVAALHAALLPIGELLTAHDVACGVPLNVAFRNTARTIRFGMVSAAVQVVAA